MSSFLGVVKEVVQNPKENISVIVLVLIVLAAIYVIATSSVEQWRYMYCTANEAQAIECTVKGWW